MGQDVKAIAYFLTQFHPFPENDAWWGKGFTEWTNSSKAKPLFKGHYQPHFPADLGYYDLRLKETRHEQIKLAKQYGIHGFCYYYYWFSGKRLLEQPLDAMFDDPESDFPYCLCWANENWTRRWDAGSTEILMEQKYLPIDDTLFIESIAKYLADPRYIRFEGKPLLIVYRPQQMPDAKRSVAVWREYCRKAGIGEIHVRAALTHRNHTYKQFDFDGSVEFPPHSMNCENLSSQISFHGHFTGYCPDYKDVAEQYLEYRYGETALGFRSVFPSWDNTARMGDRATTILNGTPENYEYWLKRAVEASQRDFPDREKFVFINAWNEWAEGAHLEPDQKYGHRFLEATARVLRGESTVSGWTHVGVQDDMRPTPAEVEAVVYVQSQSRKKSKLSRAFRKLRDTLNGRRFR
ncbi:hypothetical protein HYN69_02750 [Gemmobacter aquarius]|uniref:Glycosyltransferase WbsX n=1 Tax=Paragemmobacter aquarius TaxID=2169400 RepID=A0A2S0UIA6_9RHOB|nr:glycoside hydrolase family 99-like domain-containing protein [Gemmobacter aquarius]AWB47567.1 hypothetical protein HYN69_02750 [Gemmobacter aquarius]